MCLSVKEFSDRMDKFPTNFHARRPQQSMKIIQEPCSLARACSSRETIDNLFIRRELQARASVPDRYFHTNIHARRPQQSMKIAR